MIAYRKRLPVQSTWSPEESGVSTAPGQVGLDWRRVPFTDITVVEGVDRPCPSDYPDEVIYDIWPGTRMMCDCIERSFEYFLDINCNKGKNGDHNSDQCYDVGGTHPVVQSNLNGVKVCGKRGG